MWFIKLLSWPVKVASVAFLGLGFLFLWLYASLIGKSGDFDLLLDAMIDATKELK